MRIEIIALAILSFISVGAAGQQMDYTAWKEEAKSNIRLLPEYGNVAKTKEQKEADEDFIKTSISQDGTRKKAAQHLIELGFKYLYKQDPRTAMYRFNQAWLLDPKNEDAYWGFGGVYFMFSDFDNAMQQYDKGLLLNPRSSNILTDKATIHLTLFNEKGAKSELNSAIDIFKQSYKIAPKNQNTLFKLSACYFLLNDCKNARKYYSECKVLGGSPITPEYEEALNEKCSK